VPGISAVPHEDNLRYFDVMIHGPSQSPYEGKSPCFAYFGKAVLIVFLPEQEGFLSSSYFYLTITP
jgi:hypothetical protein